MFSVHESGFHQYFVFEIHMNNNVFYYIPGDVCLNLSNTYNIINVIKHNHFRFKMQIRYITFFSLCKKSFINGLMNLKVVAGLKRKSLFLILLRLFFCRYSDFGLIFVPMTFFYICTGFPKSLYLRAYKDNLKNIS